MSLDRQGGRRPSRRAREKRAYQLSVAGAGAGVVAVVTALLAAIGVIGFGIPVAALLVAIVCVVLFRQTVGRG